MLLNNRYEYNPDTDLIGRGGLAEVFKAYDRQRDCYVALKKFQTADSLKYGIREEFQKSIQFAHGNIVRAFDFFTVVRKFEDGDTHETQYGVMELVEGGDLADYLKKKPTNEELLEVVKGILKGLDYLHTPDPNTNKRRIIHRDIKPGNILIFYNDEGKPIPKIADFNVAKEVSSNLESSVSMVGTYEYMAPEQLNVTKYGIDHHVHANADLWALGVILCDYFMGKSLFGRRSEGNTQGQIIGNILDKQIPAEEIKNLSAPFNGIIARCLVRSAKDRAKSGKELFEYLSSIEGLETTGVCNDSSNVVTKVLNESKVGTISKAIIESYIFGIILIVLLVLFVLFLVYKFDLDYKKNLFANQMVYVEGGSYMMGCTSEQNNKCYINEKPPHSQTVSSFYIGKNEVTQEQWRAVMGSNPSFNSSCEQCPVENVSYNDILEFLSMLNQLTSIPYRLPTEAEWEYAARGGKNSKGNMFSGSNNIDSVAWYNYDIKKVNYSTRSTTYQVGSKYPNELGLYDMSGNVWEWCQDWYKGYPGSSGVSNLTGSNRVLRGGSWLPYALCCRTTIRLNKTPDDYSNDIGFRIASDQ